MAQYFEVSGGKKLSGEITVNSSKNAAVALLMASLINRGKTTLKNVPQIEEVRRLIEVMKSIGIQINSHGRDLEIIPPAEINMGGLDVAAAERTRSIILLVGALVGRLPDFSIPQAGGCRLGSRTITPHLFAFEKFGIKTEMNEIGFRVESQALHGAEIIMYECGDTATENALVVAAQIPQKSVIKLASANYMVQDVCFFLEKLGVKIKGIGTSTLEVEGLEKIEKDVEYEVSEDPIEAMFFLSVAATTNSELEIKRCPIEFLGLELLKLEKMGFQYEITQKYLARNERTQLVDIVTHPSKLAAVEDKIHPLPSSLGINIDNLPFFVPIAMLADGKTLIHDWVYENRAIYFAELNRLGGQVTLMDPHRVMIEGPAKLQGAEMVCPPALRPAAIILVAMLAAKGNSILREVYPIERGYENLVERLQKIGAEIKRVEG